MNNRVHIIVVNVTGYTPTTIQMQLKLDYNMKIVLSLPKSYNLIKAELVKRYLRKGGELKLLFDDPVFGSRVLTLLTLSFHIIYATIGVGVPLMIMIAHWVGIKKKDEHYILMAKRWARGFAVTVAVGVVTGTAIGLQLSLLWPNFMELAGNIIALPLFLEVFAFFFEAIFLGIYAYTWRSI